MDVTLTFPDDSLATRASLLARLRDWDNHGSWQEFFDTYWQLIYRVGLKFGLTDAEVRRAYAQAKAFVWAARLEPFGLVLLEAMASALPIVAVAEGGVLESVSDGRTGLLVERDEAKFAAALKRILADRALSSRLGHDARIEIEENWTWEAAANRLEEQLALVAVQSPTKFLGIRAAEKVESVTHQY